MVPRGDGFPPSLVRHRAPQPSWLVCLERNRFINQQDNAEKSSLSGEQLHLDFKNYTESLNFLPVLLTFFYVLGNSVRGSHRQRILFPLKMFVLFF